MTFYSEDGVLVAFMKNSDFLYMNSGPSKLKVCMPFQRRSKMCPIENINGVCSRVFVTYIIALYSFASRNSVFMRITKILLREQNALNSPRLLVYRVVMITVELPLLKHLWNHENMLETR